MINDRLLKVDHFSLIFDNVIHFSVEWTYNELMEGDMNMDQFAGLLADVIHLVRFGSEGRSREVKSLARRMAQEYRSSSPDFANSLALLAGGNGSLRSAKRPLPVDVDSRMALARVYDAALARKPVLPLLLDQQIEQLVSEHRRGNELKLAGLAPAKAALLVGPPGVGKTMTAHWIAHQLERPLVVLDLASSVSSFLGKTGQNLRQLFDFSKEFDCVLLLDEVDAIAKRRSDETDLGELKRLVNVLLQELDEWPEGSLVLAATNHPEILDPAVWRRFDLVIHLPLPSIQQRMEILQQVPSISNESIITALAEASDGLNYGEITNLVNAGRRTAILQRTDEEASIVEAFADHVKSLPRAMRHKLSELLMAAGVSQRKSSELTGTSRNTLRKNTKSQP